MSKVACEWPVRIFLIVIGQTEAPFGFGFTRQTRQINPDSVMALSMIRPEWWFFANQKKHREHNKSGRYGPGGFDGKWKALFLAQCRLSATLAETGFEFGTNRGTIFKIDLEKNCNDRQVRQAETGCTRHL